VRKVLVEFLLLAVVEGVLGIGVAYAGTNLPRHPNKKGQDGTCPSVVAGRQPWYSRQNRPCAMRGGANHE
jgi:hypothetical protein